MNKKASPPGRHQEQESKQRCTFRPTTFSSVRSSVRKGYCFPYRPLSYTYNISYADLPEEPPAWSVNDAPSAPQVCSLFE